ncbi:MAG: MFS transporter [Candidatus Dormibacteraeota bacterium]|nr:MFS transporter [Candidatus Dormibacteraeota bacterium]
MSASLYRAIGGAPRGGALAALRHRNFRAYLPGQALSMVGMSMLGVTIAWLVYARSASILLVGLAIALQYLPLPAGQPFARLLLTTVSQRRVLLGTQTLFCCIAAALVVITVLQPPTTRVWALLLFSILWGAVRATDAPVRHAFLVDLVGRRDLTYGLSVVASAWNVASFTGAALAGLLLFWVPPEICFVAILVAMLAGVAGLLLVAELPAVVSGDTLWQQGVWRKLMRDTRSPRVVALVVLGCAFSALGMNRLTLLPGLFADRLNTGALGFGVGVAAVGAGATVGGALLLWRVRRPLRLSLLWPGVLWALAMILAGWSTFWPLTLGALAATGAMQTWLLSIVGQRLVDVLPDRERGPVMGLYAWFAVATNWVGPLQAGLLALLLGVPLALSVDAALLIAVSLVVALALRGARSSTAGRESTSAAR